MSKKKYFFSPDALSIARNLSIRKYKKHLKILKVDTIKDPKQIEPKEEVKDLFKALLTNTTPLP